MWWTIGKAVIAAVILVAVSEIAKRYPRLGALLLTLPVASILAFIFTWTRHEDLTTVSRNLGSGAAGIAVLCSAGVRRTMGHWLLDGVRHWHRAGISVDRSVVSIWTGIHLKGEKCLARKCPDSRSDSADLYDNSATTDISDSSILPLTDTPTTN